MQNLTSTLGRLTVVLAGALALGSCSRAEYAFLPKSASYLGTTTAAPKARRVAAAPAVAVAPTAEVVATTPEAPFATAPVAVAAPIAIAPVAAKPAATKPRAAVAGATIATASAPAAAPQKPTLVQRMALAKVTKKMDKLMAKSQFKKGDNTASTSRIDGNLRTGIILLLIGLLVGLLNGLIGTIIAIIGVVFIVLWLLDAL
ncbi:hypothetical protein QMK33_07720 [Hymenobacter sp. H14-R3]|uniref:hypothetical protein n=1 Tax=Hymenobacter sp. H14-R3 TaxID=3046308 RepID=UPI0024B9032F|nr:hypothetical protein [Hymenobacter sp. H14-R3]MDJ0365037.1 hypothetical protein [Hymenobacter sp. H14-R3]